MFNSIKGKLNRDEKLYKRVRIFFKEIYKDENAAQYLDKQISNIIGVRYSKSNYITGRTLIVFDEELIDEYKIKDEINTYLATINIYYENETAASMENINSDKCSECNENDDYKLNYHTLSKYQIKKMFQTDYEKGLNRIYIQERQKQYGLNVISDTKRKSFFQNFIECMNDNVVKVLLGVSVVSFALGQIPEAIAITGIVLLQSILGAVEQHKSDNSLSSLKNMMVQKAKVIRNNKEEEIESKYIVPGDIILLEAGDKVPADARIISCSDLKVTEASLTGESIPVEKNDKVCDENAELADRHNMIFMGTSILSGKAKAVVVAIGRKTEIGKIAVMLDNINLESTVLQSKTERFINKLIKTYLRLFVIIGGLSLLAGRSFTQVLIMGVSFFLASIPEGLPVIVTTCMALSVQRMAKKNAIVRKISAVENLGSASVICCDKTGTLTMNEMTVKNVYADGCLYNLSGSGYNPVGQINLIEGDNKRNNSLELLLKSGVFCNNASLIKDDDKWIVQGDPTEGALITAAHKLNLDVDNLRKVNKCIKEIPFDSRRKYMTSLVETGEGNYAYCKGAADTIIDKCKMIYDNGQERLFTNTDKEKIKYECDKMADKALRVLAFAYKKVENENSDMDNNFVFLGFVGMEDPPREDVKESIQKCFKAGIKVVMITGDHMKTASAIGKQLGLLTDGLVVSGSELDSMSDEELYSKINNIQVFARTSPEQKYRIVKAFKKCGHVVAMTGDGVNDAPAIKEAHIGIAMGESGSDVAKDASCITLVDDNFSTIVAAIEEGRGVSNNIRNSMKYLFSGAIGEMSAILLASLIGGISPLLPIQIIWINVISENLLGSSLALEPPSKDVMNDSPVSKNAPLIDKKLGKKIVKRGIGIGISTFAIFKGAMFLGLGLAKARTLAFANFICSQVANVYDSRQNKKAFSNRYMNRMAGISMAFLGAIIYMPFLNSFFGTVPLGPLSWIAVLGLSNLSRI